MCRLAILLLVAVTAGCGQSSPPDLRPFVAVAVRYSIMAAPSSPNVKPGDVCSNCRGAKVVGDGTIKITCPHCKGTGIEPGK